MKKLSTLITLMLLVVMWALFEIYTTPARFNNIPVTLGAAFLIIILLIVSTYRKDIFKLKDSGVELNGVPLDPGRSVDLGRGVGLLTVGIVIVFAIGFILYIYFNPA